jgi:hypothetical protein
MSERDDGGPAFPFISMPVPGQPLNIRQQITSNGMRLRDYFAAQALIGLAAHAEGRGADRLLEDPDDDAEAYIAILANGAYEIADAMLKARKA